MVDVRNRVASRLAVTLIFGFVLLSASSCIPDQEPLYSSPLERGLAEHGGVDVFQSFRGLEFDLVRGDRSERHTIDLERRLSRVDGDSFSLGYDGENAWLLNPGGEYSGDPRFYHNLYFYFFAFPFVLADPGINAETLQRTTVDSTEFDVVRITYDSGVGETPDDEYIVYFDPESGLLDFVRYTVTFQSQAPSTNYNAQKYRGWHTVDGLLVPGRLEAYHWDEETDTFGEKRGETEFQNVRLSTEALDASLFVAGQEAEIFPPR